MSKVRYLGSPYEDSPYRDMWNPGDQAHFEYHCHRGHDSEDYPLWYRSHQPVTIMNRHETDLDPYLRGEKAWRDDEFGGPFPHTPEMRMDYGMPFAYQVKFPDHHQGTVMEEELYTHPRYFDPQGGPPSYEEQMQNHPEHAQRLGSHKHAFDEDWGDEESPLTEFYHFAPTTERARIQQHGLQPSTPRFNPYWGEDPEGTLAEQPQGVYAYGWDREGWGEPSHEDLAYNAWGEVQNHPEKYDVWRIPYYDGPATADPRGGEESYSLNPHKPIYPEFWKGGPEEFGSWPNKKSTFKQAAKVPVNYHGQIDPVNEMGNLKGYAGRWPTLYDGKAVHIGPEGSVHLDLRDELGVDQGWNSIRLPPETGMTEGWIGSNEDKDSGDYEAEYGGDRYTPGTRVGWYNEGRVPHPDVEMSAYNYWKTFLKPDISPDTPGGYGHGPKLTNWQFKQSIQTPMSYDPTRCSSCGGLMSEPKMVGNQWMNRCTRCGRTRVVPMTSPLFQQHQQNFPAYPEALRAVGPERPWFTSKQAQGPVDEPFVPVWSPNTLELDPGPMGDTLRDARRPMDPTEWQSRQSNWGAGKISQVTKGLSQKISQPCFPQGVLTP